MIVGLTGYKQSGKSVVANVFRQHGYFYAPFADPLKKMILTLLLTRGVPEQVATRALWGDLKEMPLRELEGHTSRWAMQTLGTEWGRNTIGTSLWINAWKDTIKAKPLVVVDDIRFPNEVDIVHELDGCVIRIDREGGGSSDAHPSEMYIRHLPVDGTINNGGTLDRLQAIANSTAIELAGQAAGIEHAPGDRPADAPAAS
jgi:hypothetical protein